MSNKAAPKKAGSTSLISRLLRPFQTPSLPDVSFDLESRSGKAKSKKTILDSGVKHTKLLMGTLSNGRPRLINVSLPMALVGPAGSGKTYLNKLFAAQYALMGYPVLFINCAPDSETREDLINITADSPLKWIDLSVLQNGGKGFFSEVGSNQELDFFLGSLSTPLFAYWSPSKRTFDEARHQIEQAARALQRTVSRRNGNNLGLFGFSPGSTRPILVIISESEKMVDCVGAEFLDSILKLSRISSTNFIYDTQFASLLDMKESRSTFNYCLLCGASVEGMDEFTKARVNNLSTGQALVYTKDLKSKIGSSFHEGVFLPDVISLVSRKVAAAQAAG